MYKHKLHSLSVKRNVIEKVKIYICETTLVSILHKVTSQGGLQQSIKTLSRLSHNDIVYSLSIVWDLVYYNPSHHYSFPNGEREKCLSFLTWQSKDFVLTCVFTMLLYQYFDVNVSK